jgi:hypothetical protein
LEDEVMKRVRKNRDGSETVFSEIAYDDPKRPYHAEIQVSLEELRDLKREGKLIALRMVGTTKAGKRQKNLVSWRDIEDFDWK